MKKRDYITSDYQRGYSSGYAAGKKKMPDKLVYVSVATYSISLEEQHLRFMHWLRLKSHEDRKWDSGISTTAIVEMFKNDEDFQKRYYKTTNDEPEAKG